MKDILKQVTKLEISTKRLVDGLISGNYHSVFKGQGIEFSEIRDYIAGDDVRAIDWKVTARYNHPFVKEFIEERDVRMYIALDVSQSASFGNIVQKKQKALELTASLLFSAVRNNDAVGLFLFSENVELYIPARKGKKHALAILSRILNFSAQKKQTNISDSLYSILNVLKRKGILFLISDFTDSDFTRPLSLLQKRHDVIAVRVSDTREKEIPDVGYIQLEDPETGEQLLIDTSDEGFRSRYKKLVENHDEQLKQTFQRQKIDKIELFSDQSYTIALKNFFQLRKRRVNGRI